jgi:hypothetical protein
MNVSPDFSPSIKLMKPYFLLSALAYLASMVLLFFIDFKSEVLDLALVGWVHLYMLGFVMMAIFSAMAQLGPVVVETKHYNTNVFHYVWSFLSVGLLFMLYGFFVDISALPFGGILVLIAMSSYAIEFLLTLKNMRRKTSITRAMKMSNFFLLFGILSGIVMAFSLSGTLSLNPHEILPLHTFTLIVGFVVLLIMGISIILIPMFGYAKRISDNVFSQSFITLSTAVGVMILSYFFEPLRFLAYTIGIGAVLLYFKQLYTMYKSRKKIVHDIWARSYYVGFISFFLAFTLFVSSLIVENEVLLKGAVWLLLVGFVGFLIMGNFYKIIPFLVWFQIYSPVIEERAVPMLHELLPKRLTELQWIYSTFGLLLSTYALLSENETLFYGGVVLLGIGGTLFLIIINNILKIKL